MFERLRTRAQKLGLAPGTLVYVGDEAPKRATLTLFAYDQATATERPLGGMEEFAAAAGQAGVSWLNVDGLDPAVVEAVGRLYDVHPLLLEDMLNTEQRPKVEFADSYAFIVLRMLSWNAPAQELESEQVSLLLTEHSVITFQESPGDVFDPVRRRIRENQGRVRKAGADYLAYSLIDIVVDHYFTVLERISDLVESVEDDLLEEPTTETLARIHHLKRTAIALRRSVWPLREVINSLLRSESKLLKKPTVMFLKDLYDHTVQVADTVETQRDLIGSLLDVYLSSISNRMNEVMKVLTVIATVFIPLTFIAGVYGMNFTHMPELHWSFGYEAALAFMAVVAIGLVAYFRWKKWL